MHVRMHFGAKVGVAEGTQRAEDFILLHPVAEDVAAAAKALPIERRAVVEAMDGVLEAGSLQGQRLRKLGAGHRVVCDELRVIENRPQKKRIATPRQQLEQLHRIDEVIENTTRDPDI